jgi:hypothetical protein
VACEAVVGWV